MAALWSMPSVPVLRSLIMFTLGLRFIDMDKKLREYTAEQYRAEAGFAELRGDGRHTADMLRHAAAIQGESA